jgi:hypothetical protein
MIRSYEYLMMLYQAVLLCIEWFEKNDDSKYSKYVLDMQHKYEEIEEMRTFWRLRLKEETWAPGCNCTYTDIMGKD